MRKAENDARKHWEKKANNLLLGKQITEVRWLDEKEANDIGWDSRPVAIQLDDGTWIMPMRDDEGNDGGALAVGADETLPVF